MVSSPASLPGLLYVTEKELTLPVRQTSLLFQSLYHTQICILKDFQHNMTGMRTRTALFMESTERMIASSEVKSDNHKKLMVNTHWLVSSDSRVIYFKVINTKQIYFPCSRTLFKIIQNGLRFSDVCIYASCYTFLTHLTHLYV